jgi:hypothetical protein
VVRKNPPDLTKPSPKKKDVVELEEVRKPIAKKKESEQVDFKLPVVDKMNGNTTNPFDTNFFEITRESHIVKASVDYPRNS